MSEQRRIVSIVEAAPSKTFLQKLLDGIERVGNKVPHPAVIFVWLIVAVIVLLPAVSPVACPTVPMALLMVATAGAELDQTTCCVRSRLVPSE